MKKLLSIFLFLMLLANKTAMAATGNSRDGLFLILFLVGVLIVFYFMLSLFDFLSKNGKKLVFSFYNFIRQILNKFVANRKLKHFEAFPL